MQARLSNEAAALAKPYLDIVRAFNPKGELKAYPGSPLIARACSGRKTASSPARSSRRRGRR